MKGGSRMLRMMKNLIAAIGGFIAASLFAAAFLSPSACALYRNDRCYVEDDQYRIAYNLFIESGSLDLVQRELKDFEWRRCAINEAVYRLEKEFEVVDR